MTLSDTRAAAMAAPSDRADQLEERLRHLAELAIAAVGGAVCALAWRTSGGDSSAALMVSSVASATRGPSAAVSRGDSNARRDRIASAALAILSRKLPESPARTSASPLMRATLSAADIAEVLPAARLEHGPSDRTGLVEDCPITLAGTVIAAQAGDVRAALVSESGLAGAQLKAVLELLIDGALAEITAHEASASRAFWRERAADAALTLASVNAASGRLHSAESELATAYTAAAKLPPRRRFAGLGEILAQAGAKVESAAGSKPGSKPAPFDGWILAVRRRGQLEVVAASAEIALPFELAQNSALARCLECGATIECARGAAVECAAAAAHSTAVWRLFKHPYICVPLDAGAIALAARGGVDDAARRRAEALAARLAPLLRAWLVEEEAAEYRALVGRLALRMFAAADEERARIARDLHDDQAQLLAAAKIALAGGREQARAIFKQLEDELRKRTRLLRPAALGRAALAEALELEFERLRQARIRVRLVRGTGVARISRPVQQLCFQVAREALSNVMRHAEATSVTVAIDRVGGVARISVSDNGRGMGAAAAGSGLAGLRERLELMGGSLRIDSRPGATTIVAEIPEPA